MDTVKVIQLPSREIIDNNNWISALKETGDLQRQQGKKGIFNLFYLHYNVQCKKKKNALIDDKYEPELS